MWVWKEKGCGHISSYQFLFCSYCISEMDKKEKRRLLEESTEHARNRGICVDIHVNLCP